MSGGRGPRRPLLATVLVLLAVPLSSLRAQEGTAGLELGLSRSLPPSGGTGTAASYLFGGGRIDWIVAGGAALRARLHGGLSEGEDRGDWIAGRTGLDLGSTESSGPGWGLELGVQGFAVGRPLSYRAAFGTVEPALRWTVGPWRLALRGHGVGGRSVVELAADASGFVPPPFRHVGTGPRVPRGGLPSGPPDGAGDREADERAADLWAWGGEAELSVEVGRTRIRLAGIQRETSVGAYRAARLGAGGPLGRLRWSGEVAAWDTPAGIEPSAYLGLSVPISGGIRAFAGGGRSRPDPVLGSRPVGEATVGLGWTADFGSAPTPLYRLVGTPASEGRRTVELRLDDPGAERVVVLGDFTGWEPVELAESDGVWKTRLAVESGVHHFGFRVDDDWHVPDAARATAVDEWGRTNAVLVVPPATDDEEAGGTERRDAARPEHV